MEEIKGDLIKLALEGKFDVIAHGCNCFCTQKAGLAPQMAKAFGTDLFYQELGTKKRTYISIPKKLVDSDLHGNINKLGNIESELFYIDPKKKMVTHHLNTVKNNVIFFKDISISLKNRMNGGNLNPYMLMGEYDYKKLIYRVSELNIINCYTQYRYHINKPLDYEALILCMRKINHQFKSRHIGLPLIGCGKAGGDWKIVKDIISKELKDCKVTIVHYKK